jgi:uncharacterized protein YdhG (YjbR/CyaY superfamily)
MPAFFVCARINGLIFRVRSLKSLGDNRQSKPTTIAEYIAAAPKEAQPKLREMLTIIRSAAPDAQESLKWSMPAFSYKRILVTFAAHKSHIGFYPTPSAMKAFADELSKHQTGAGSIQFPLDKPLPSALIKRITKFRVKEFLEQDGKWRSGRKIVIGS